MEKISRWNLMLYRIHIQKQRFYQIQ